MTPEFAIIDANMLSCMGLQQLLEEIVPTVHIAVFHSYEALVIAEPERFHHFFVASSIYFEHAQFFLSQSHRSIVLVHGNGYPHIAGLITLNVCQDGPAIVKSLLQLVYRGHAQNVSPLGSERAIGSAVLHRQPASNTPLLSAREVEVAILLAKGFINKEVADRLNISLNTVITHRKNIMEKLQARSLADIIVYVVINGLVGVEEL